MLAQLIASQSERVTSITPSSEATKVVQFMRLNPPTFTGSKVEKDPQGFVDKIEKNLRVMHAIDSEGVEFVAYQLQDVAHTWFKSGSPKDQMMQVL